MQDHSVSGQKTHAPLPAAHRSPVGPPPIGPTTVGAPPLCPPPVCQSQNRKAPAACILEVKHALDRRVESGAGHSDPEGTARMLVKMRAVLSRELDRFAAAAPLNDAQPVDGKAAIDLVSLIARTLEKIDQLESQIAAAQRDGQGELSSTERTALHRTVSDLIATLARRHAGQPQEKSGDSGDRQPGAGGTVDNAAPAQATGGHNGAGPAAHACSAGADPSAGPATGADR
ncbi:hypothetical protein [Pseudohoeflea coraliihabitans]|uniref:Uncharacterized protein n=1 Tax=Pseudohoeflea coraliihabitans TaxID=2860393 RepID=A0ABS6WUC5_9HYPH|nr:hypothetical protein [Pseudohoeflea sp. DP4N28-3]MBW3098655.1 hypothetical protein [Pseudohoeflea sp. DP4N28-3]